MKRPTRRSTRRGTLIATALTTTATIAVLLVAAAPSSALGTLICTGSSAVAFTPALTSTPQATRIDQDFLFSGCLGGPVSSGRATVPLTLTISCRFDYTSTAQSINGQGVIIRTGTIASGLYVGATAIQQNTLLGSLTDCTTRGLSTVSGPLVFTILGI